MGIDKPNIRYTIHFGIPDSLEALAQEAGRAGRDKRHAACAVIFSDHVLERSLDYLAPDISAAVALARSKVCARDGDAQRIMFLHSLTYPGVEKDVASAARIMSDIQLSWSKRKASPNDRVTCVIRRDHSEDASKAQEKAIYRLMLIGVVDDYVIEYPSAFKLETRVISLDDAEQKLMDFVRRYDLEERARETMLHTRASRKANSDFVYLIRALCEFIYERIEASRREALSNTVQVLRRVGSDGEALHTEISNYLSRSVFTAHIAELRNRIVPEDWWQILDMVTSESLRSRLWSTASRAVEANPTHPGLHLLIALSSPNVAATEPGSIAASMVAAMNYLPAEYRASTREAQALADEAIARASDHYRDRFDAVVKAIIDRSHDPFYLKAAYSHVADPGLRRTCAIPWLSDVASSVRSHRKAHIGRV
jgi:ATP-dependent DNA helicase RecQ